LIEILEFDKGFPGMMFDLRSKTAICALALAFGTSIMAPCLRAQRDPTLKGANAANHTSDAKGGQHLNRLQGLPTHQGAKNISPTLPVGNTKPGKVDPELRQAEANDSKIAGESTKKPQGVGHEKATQPAPKNVKIDFRSTPQKKGGTANQGGNGSGSKKMGPGRRITEKPH
jgi:hypothetical protein